MSDEEARTSAMLLNSTTWDRERPWLRPRNLRAPLARESLAWQNLSRFASDAEADAYPIPFRRSSTRNGKTRTIKPRAGKAPREPNRILELHGLMGAIGEQAGLARTFELDVQRLIATERLRDAVQQRVVQRAMAESAAHFTLGAVHSLTNLVLRLLLLNGPAAAVIEKAWPDSGGFPPLTDDRRAWVTLNRYTVRDLGRAERASSNAFMSRSVEALRVLYRSDAFHDLDERRGMDYHRRRPQSVAHSSPRRKAVEVSGGSMSIAVFGAALEPEADADAVHAIVVEAMEQLRIALRTVRLLVPKVIRAEGTTYIVS